MSVLAPAYAFQGPGLDRAEHLRDDPPALAGLWDAARVLLLDGDGHVYFRGGEESPQLPSGRDVAEQLPDNAAFLGCDGDRQGWFALPVSAVAEPPRERLDLRSIAATWPVLEAAAAAHARALLHWQARTRFCGGCGAELVLHRAGHAAQCARCGQEYYPRTDPAIIVAVSDGTRLLLGRQANWPEKRWSVLAGFVEPGESFEQAVAREVMEEAGVPVRAVRYVGSQPWPFPSALMVGFHAEADICEACVGPELQEARWFSANEIEQAVAHGELKLSPRLSIARWLIDSWLAAAPR
ncbi:MAG TPA: NAD(+) diphosphatase [Arenimonas sp.]|nr:NAD(+) diphosphatase [Arenimonas sp.]